MNERDIDEHIYVYAFINIYVIILYDCQHDVIFSDFIVLKILSKHVGVDMVTGVGLVE